MTINSQNPIFCVQGVQGVQGKKSPTLHSCNNYGAWPVAFLCRVCRVALYTRESINKLLPHAHSLACIYTLHTLHALHRLCASRSTAVHGVFNTLHTLHNQYILQKIMKIVCGEDNFEEFTAEFKKQAPEFYALAKHLHAAGMIVGFRGASLDINPDQQINIDPKTNDAASSKQLNQPVQACKNCRHWRKDEIGNGTGIGTCLLNSRPAMLKWPNAYGCHHYEVTA